MVEITYGAKVSKSGKRVYINIPIEFHSQLKTGDHVRVVISSI